MNKDRLLFEIYKDRIIDKHKIKKLADNPTELYVELVNYQLLKYGEQIMTPVETREDRIRKNNKAKNRIVQNRYNRRKHL